MIVSSWRISRAEPSGLVMWFDPESEVPCIRPLTEAEKAVRVDSTVSVRGLTEAEADVAGSLSIPPQLFLF